MEAHASRVVDVPPQAAWDERQISRSPGRRSLTSRADFQCVDERSDRITQEVAWRVTSRDDGGVIISDAVRLDIPVPADPQRFADLQSQIDRKVAETCARVPHSFA